MKSLKGLLIFFLKLFVKYRYRLFIQAQNNPTKAQTKAFKQLKKSPLIKIDDRNFQQFVKNHPASNYKYFQKIIDQKNERKSI